MSHANNDSKFDESRGYGIVDPANLIVAKSKKEIKEELHAWAKIAYDIYQERKIASKIQNTGV